MGRFSKFVTSAVVPFIVLISLVLIVTAVSMLSQYADEISVQSSSKAQLNTLQAKESVNAEIEKLRTQGTAAAIFASEYKTEEEFYSYLTNIIANDGFSDILFTRFYKDGVLYTSTGMEYTDSDGTRTVESGHPTETQYAGVFTDTSFTQGSMSVAAVYAPVADSQFADAITLYYPGIIVTEFYDDSLASPEAEFSVLCGGSGEIYVGFQKADGSDLSAILYDKCGQKSIVDDVFRLMQRGENGTVPMTVGGNDYLVSVCADKSVLADLSVVEFYRVDVLSASNFEFIRAIIGILIIFAVIALGVILYLIIHRIILKRAFTNAQLVNLTLDCPTRHGFEVEAGKILDKQYSNYYAVIVVYLRHYKYLHETFGEDDTKRLLSYLRVICKRTLQMEETYGYMENGQFLLLLHAKDREALLDRLKTHRLVSSKYRDLHNFDINLKYGIFEWERGEDASVPHMIDYAVEANNAAVSATKENASGVFNFFSSEIRKVRQINDDMELHMESALQNGEFHVFYQAKYNLHLGRQDGAEALVRWYDPKTGEYNRPALFMPLFETNGFIVKLDKYVYTKVCEYINYSIASGRNVFPVSVNVSRITAVQDDFVESYSAIKKKYGITDGQIMIEFTESFAYDNQEVLNNIVKKLHAAGFKCSIDDFGCGYSSYQILKCLPMDEIKLDKFFLEKGFSEERDNYVIESIVNVAKKLNMKVTQEGVETPEELERLRTLGCDVIQGYLYSHPLPQSDYINFVANTREHNL